MSEPTRYAARGAYGPEGGHVDAFTEEDTRHHIGYLTGKLKSDDPEKRRKAAEAIAAYIGDCVDLLPEEMDPHPAAELAAVLEKPRCPKPHILDAMRALGIMGKFAARHAGAAAARHLRSEDTDIRFCTLRALGYMGEGAGEAAGSKVAAVMLESTDALLRYEAAKTLVGLGPGAARSAARELAQAAKEEEDTNTLQAILQALGSLGPKGAKVGAPVLKDFLKKDVPYVLQRLAVTSLGQMGEAAAKVASQAVADSLRPTASSDAEVRRRAAATLQAMGPKAVFEHDLLIARALFDKDAGVREAAKAALESAGHTRALKGPIALYTPPDEVAALGVEFLVDGSDDDIPAADAQDSQFGSDKLPDTAGAGTAAQPGAAP